MYARFRVCRISFRERDPGVTTDFGVTTGNFIPQQERERKRERERERERGVEGRRARMVQWSPKSIGGGIYQEERNGELAARSDGKISRRMGRQMSRAERGGARYQREK